MTQVFPISSVTTPASTSATASTGSSTTSSSQSTTGDSGQIDQDTFLKLLVAQLKYQDPLSPADSTQFLTQTAQFTELETLQKIETEQQTLAQSSQMLSAASMVGRPVTYSLATSGTPAAPTGTTVVSVRGTLPKDAPTGTHETANTSIFTKTGQKVALTLQFTKTDSDWTVQAMSNGQTLGPAMNLGFGASGEYPSNDLTISASALDGSGTATGDWPPAGITLGFGSTGDATRLQIASGPATVAVAEQNGNDGNTASGIPTGIHMTANGPQLVIGGQNIPLTSISDVSS